MRIASIQGSSLLDFPKSLSCILFTQGCQYDCFYCHNRPLIAPVGSREEVDALSFLKRRIGLLDGVVITGGEPTIHRSLGRFIEAVKAMGFRVKLDTNGSNPSCLAALLKEGLLDYVALDVKATEAQYRLICGPRARWETVMESLEHLGASSCAFEVRTTVYPTMKGEDLEEIADNIGKVRLWRLNHYRIPDQYKDEDRNLVFSPVMDRSSIEAWIERNRDRIQALDVTT